VVDYPHSTRAKKFFLVLMVGPSMVSMPQVGNVCYQVGVVWKHRGRGDTRPTKHDNMPGHSKRQTVCVQCEMQLCVCV